MDENNQFYQNNNEPQDVPQAETVNEPQAEPQAAPQQEAYTAPQQEAYTAPQQDTYTAPQQDAYTAPQSQAYTTAGTAYRTEAAAKAAKAAKKKNKKKHSTGAVLAIALSAAVLAGAVGSAGSYLALKPQIDALSENQEASNQASAESGKADNSSSTTNTTTVTTGSRETSEIQVVETDTSKVLTNAELYAANVNAVVGIQTQITTNYWGYETSGSASGSGFIYTSDGYIITNYHVVEDATSISVITYDNESYDATLVGYDSTKDVAVLKIDATGLQTVILGDSDQMNVGDEVAAIGNPLGELTFSLTTGVVSALNREVTISDVEMNLIQTDCAINSGNSGGPLFNMYGEVIGITNAKISSSSSSSSASVDNIGFAIPIQDVRDTIDSIIENGYVVKPYIGVSIISVSQQTQQYYGLPAGAAVQSVVEGSPAAEAGLQANDIITKVNDEETDSSSSLISAIGKCEIGETITLTVYRQGAYQELTLTVGQQIQAANASETETDAQAETQTEPQTETRPQGSK